MTKATRAPLKPYDRVRVAAIRDDRFATLPIDYRRHPGVGDVAVIVHTHQAEYVYEVECSDPSLEECADIDSTTLGALVEFDAWLCRTGRLLLLARVKEDVRDVLARAGSLFAPGAEHLECGGCSPRCAGNSDRRADRPRRS